MNRGALQSSPVQQMMAAGNPNWWNINTMLPPPQPNHLQQPPSPTTFFPQFTPPSSSSSSSYNSSSLHIPSWHDNHELPQSWSQLLLGGLMGGEEQALHHVKQENPASAGSYVQGHANEDFHHYHHQQQQGNEPAAWSHQITLMAAAAAASSSSSSPKSCVTSFSSNNNMLEFSDNQADTRQTLPDQSSECNDNATGGAMKKARVLQPSATQSTFKARKEKLGDRITALHQLVSPFGKTDTASVLLEAFGYIRFLQSQIGALSLPYLDNGQGNTRQQQPVKGERNCIFPEDPGQECHEEPKDLRSRGLCLVPVSYTLHVGSDNAADYWAPVFGGVFR